MDKALASAIKGQSENLLSDIGKIDGFFSKKGFYRWQNDMLEKDDIAEVLTGAWEYLASCSSLYQKVVFTQVAMYGDTPTADDVAQRYIVGVSIGGDKDLSMEKDAYAITVQRFEKDEKVFRLSPLDGPRVRTDMQRRLKQVDPLDRMLEGISDYMEKQG